ncbi:MAG: response regulator transcription factor [Chloroflexi bacterium]|nr:response regulator transcription factor [Chloroflexota bacterium]
MPTWMVVEDEPDIYDVLLAMFELWGIEGVAFVDGGEAIAWIDAVDEGRVHGDLPELAILDIRLPEASGPEVGNRLRKSAKLQNVAIVLITAYRLSSEEEQSVIEQAGADKLMYKPLPAMPELRAILDDIVDKRRKMRAKAKSATTPEKKTESKQEESPPNA